MAALVRDNFTGSGTLSGRVPDTSGAEAWGEGDADAPLTNGVISGDRLTMAGYGYNARMYVPSAPLNCYLELQFLSGVTGWQSEVEFGMRGTYSESHRYANANSFTVQRESATQVFLPWTPIYIPVTSFTVANAGNVVIRFELEGDTQRIYLDGGLVSEVTQADKLKPSGDCFFIKCENNASFEYVEFGALSSPPVPTKSLVPVRFGVPEVIQAEPQKLSPASLAPARFGNPGNSIGLLAQPLRPLQFGQAAIKSGTDQEFALPSLRPVLFGASWIQQGVQPADIVMPARSLAAARLGHPAAELDAISVNPVSLAPVRFGRATLSQSVMAQSLAPIKWGAVVVELGQPAASMRPAHFGRASVASSLSVQSLQPVRMGRIALQGSGVNLPANSLYPVRFGVSDSIAMAVHARPLGPVRMGRPFIDRGASC